MADSEFARLRDEYAREAEGDEELAEYVASRLRCELARRRVNGSVEHRPKDPDSAATKALLAGMAEPLRDLGDRSGVRASVYYLEDVERVEATARDLFQVIHVEDKLDALQYDEVGYLGRHIDLRLREDDPEHPALAGRRAELQVRTAAQGAWAHISHEQLYKPQADVPEALKRRIFRLVALVELFDNEVAGFLAEARATPGYAEAQALAPLARVLLERFDDRRSSDRQLSLTLAAALVPLYEVEPAEVYEGVLSTWIAERDERLRAFFEEFGAQGDINPLIHQPELFVILERLERDRLRVLENWPEATVPAEWLEELADAWGIRLKVD